MTDPATPSGAAYRGDRVLEDLLGKAGVELATAELRQLIAGVIAARRLKEWRRIVTTCGSVVVWVSMDCLVGLRRVKDRRIDVGGYPPRYVFRRG